ncbi:nuclear transport factor 2 family protein [Streptosporangium sp. NPDC003464]
MYSTIVARRVRTAWNHLNDRDIESVLRMFAPTFTHRFAGENAMGGVRDNIDSQRRWFERLFRLLTDIRFTVDDVLVKGWPWRTRVVALVRTSGTAAGHPFRNEFAQTIELRWGQITRVNVVEDTEKMATIIGHLIESGVEEAGAPQIRDRPDPRDLDSRSPDPR